jgi:hypothetical protein
MFPGSLGGYPGLGGMFPGSLGDYPGAGGFFPGMLVGYPGLMGGIYGPDAWELLKYANSYTKDLGDAYFGESGSDDGGIPSKIASTVTNFAGGTIDYLSFIDTDFGGQKYTKLAGLATLLPLQGVAPWVGNTGFQMSVDGAGFGFDVIDKGFDWYNKFKESSIASYTKKGNILSQIPSFLKFGATEFWSDTKAATSKVISKFKAGTLWKDGLNKFNKLDDIPGLKFLKRGGGILSAFGAVTNTFESIHHFQSGDITDGIGSGIGALGDTLLAGSLLAGPYAPAVATAGLLLSGASLAIRYRKQIGQAIGKAVSFAGDMYDKAYSFTGNVINGATDLVTSGIDAVTKGASSIVGGTGNFIANGIEGISSSIGNSMQPRIVGQGVEFIGSQAANVTANVAQGVSNTVESVGKTVSNTVDNVGKGIGNGVKATGKAIGSGLKAVGNFFGG